MGNFCGLCSCIYPKLDEFDDEEYFASKFAIERNRVNDVYSTKSPMSLHSDVNSISSYSSSKSTLAGTFQTKQALTQRRLSLASNSSYKFDRHSLFGARSDRQSEIFTIYSPIKLSSRDMMLWPSSNSSIVSLNDHRLFLEVADLHMSEIKRQFKQDANNMSLFTIEDSGINMSLADSSVALQFNETATPSKNVDADEQKSTASQRGGRVNDGDEGQESALESSSPLVYLFKTINAITSTLIKTAYLNTSQGSNYLYKWSAKNSITKLRSKMFKLASFSIAAFVNTTTTTTTKPSTSSKLFKKSSKKTHTAQPILIEDQTADLSLYGPVDDTYSLAKTSPLRQFILRVYDANFF